MLSALTGVNAMRTIGSSSLLILENVIFTFEYLSTNKGLSLHRDEGTCPEQLWERKDCPYQYFDYLTYRKNILHCAFNIIFFCKLLPNTLVLGGARGGKSLGLFTSHDGHEHRLNIPCSGVNLWSRRAREPTAHRRSEPPRGRKEFPPGAAGGKRSGTGRELGTVPVETVPV